jgi:hypothetical protein
MLAAARNNPTVQTSPQWPRRGNLLLPADLFFTRFLGLVRLVTPFPGGSSDTLCDAPRFCHSLDSFSSQPRRSWWLTANRLLLINLQLPCVRSPSPTRCTSRPSKHPTANGSCGSRVHSRMITKISKTCKSSRLPPTPRARSRIQESPGIVPPEERSGRSGLRCDGSLRRHTPLTDSGLDGALKIGAVACFAPLPPSSLSRAQPSRILEGKPPS